MKEFSAKTEEVMRRYGLWSLTAQEDLLKGTLYDPNDNDVYGSYLDANDLREIAAACTEIADYLESVEKEASHATN